MATLMFLGGAGTVTGSRYLLEAGGERLMIDCGLFQGEKELRLRNWSPFPVDPSTIQWLVLTHAHLDHTGYIPRFVNEGFRGQILATQATVDLSNLLLPDSKTPRMPTRSTSANTNPLWRSTPTRRR
jgi:metallo-beta-lactamase family protein